jgi:hypothetical protein
MDYKIVPAQVDGFPPSEKLYFEGRCGGMVYRDPRPPAEMDDMWVAYTRGGQAAETRDAEIAKVLGTSRLVIAVTLSRSRARLRKLLTTSGEQP